LTISLILLRHPSQLRLNQQHSRTNSLVLLFRKSLMRKIKRPLKKKGLKSLKKIPMNL
jgi:hypothetical protein